VLFQANRYRSLQVSLVAVCELNIFLTYLHLTYRFTSASGSCQLDYCSLDFRLKATGSATDSATCQISTIARD